MLSFHTVHPSFPLWIQGTLSLLTLLAELCWEQQFKTENI